MKPELSQKISALANAKSRDWLVKHHRQVLLGLLLLHIGIVAMVWYAERRAQHELKEAAAELSKQSVVPFEKRLLPAINAEGVIMAVSHCREDVRGIQFHPESILTPAGRMIIVNWLRH